MLAGRPKLLSWSLKQMVSLSSIKYTLAFAPNCWLGKYSAVGNYGIVMLGKQHSLVRWGIAQIIEGLPEEMIFQDWKRSRTRHARDEYS